MSHLKHFGVGNFKVFKELTHFDLAPITILTGKNNSGKSSLIKSMLLLKNSPVENINLFRGHNFEKWTFDRSELKLGSAEKFLNYEKNSKIVNFELALNIPMLPNGLIFLEYSLNNNAESFDLVAFKIKNENETIIEFDNNFPPDSELKQKVKVDFRYFIDGIKKFAALKEDQFSFAEKIGLYRQSSMETKSNEPIIKLLELVDSDLVIMGLSNPSVPQGNTYVGGEKIDISKDDLKIIQDCLFEAFRNGFIQEEKLKYGSLFSKFNKATAKELTIKEKILDIFNNDEFLLKKYQTACSHRVILENQEKAIFLDPKLHFFFDYINIFLENLFYEFQKEFVDIPYLPSIRAMNERIYLVSKEGYAIQAIDEKSWNELGLEKEKEKNGEFYKVYQKALIDFEIGEEIKIKTYERTATQITITRNGREVILSDLGFGYAQLIPIIFTILDKARKYWPFWESQNEAHKSSIPCPRILIEEPESNLHPDFQSKLADLFVEASKKFGIQFIIETHSEYFIRRLQYLTARKDIKPEDISIYYFNNPEKVPAGEKQITKIEIGSDGSLSREFGSGFLDEADNLAMSLFILSKHQKN